MNVITYRASAKLPQTTSIFADGLHTSVFSGANGQLTITSHTFEDGVGRIEFNDDITRVGDYGFAGCTNLTSIELPDSVTYIGLSSFDTCSNLTSINIPNNVTSFNNNAFANCSSLTSIEIPSNVATIGNDAFSSCTSLNTIICHAVTAPIIDTRVFEGVASNGTLYVPIGSSGYDTWMGTGNYYLGKYNWTKVEQ